MVLLFGLAVLLKIVFGDSATGRGSVGTRTSLTFLIKELRILTLGLTSCAATSWLSTLPLLPETDARSVGNLIPSKLVYSDSPFEGATDERNDLRPLKDSLSISLSIIPIRYRFQRRKSHP
jgi:hypothetical protein